MGNNKMYIDTLINNKAKNNKENSLYIDNKSFVCIMKKMKENLELISELNFLTDYKNEILKCIKDENFLHHNKILNFEEICKFDTKDELKEVFKFFESQSICVVIEPNKNMYLSLDYNKIIPKMKEYASYEAIGSLILHDKVQRFAIVNKSGNIELEKINNFRNEVIISCDFEKNPTIFSYSCEAIDMIDIGLKIYNKVYL